MKGDFTLKHARCCSYFQDITNDPYIKKKKKVKKGIITRDIKKL